MIWLVIDEDEDDDKEEEKEDEYGDGRLWILWMIGYDDEDQWFIENDFSGFVWIQLDGDDDDEDQDNDFRI